MRESRPSQRRISESNWSAIQYLTFQSTVNTYKVVVNCTNVHILWCLVTYIQHFNSSTTLGQRPYRRPIKKLILLQTNTFQDITNQTLFMPVSTYTTVKKMCANFAISRAEALDIFDQFICQELGCKSRAQGNVWKSKLGGASHFQLLQLRLRWGQCNYCLRANKSGTFLIWMWDLPSFGLIPSTATPLNIDI